MGNAQSGRKYDHKGVSNKHIEEVLSSAKGYQVDCELRISDCGFKSKESGDSSQESGEKEYSVFDFLFWILNSGF